MSEGPVQPTTAERPTPRRRTQARGAITRERILDAAEALFSERGYEGASLREVADSVGIRNPSLYNHFDSKESLYAAVLERGIRPVLQSLVDAVDDGRDGSVVASEIIAVTMRVFAERPAIPRLVQHEALAGGQRLTPMLRSFISPVFSAGTEMAKSRALEAGWDEADVPYLVLALIQALLGLFTMAPLLDEVEAGDSMSEEVLAHHTRFLIELAERLFTPPPIIQS